MLKVGRRNRRMQKWFLIQKGKRRNAFKIQEIEHHWAEKEEPADFIDDKIQVLQLFAGHGNGDRRTKMLLLPVRRWCQRMRTLSQEKGIASLAIHKTLGCNILTQATTCKNPNHPMGTDNAFDFGAQRKDYHQRTENASFKKENRYYVLR
jgi:hypothetical protein